MIYRVFFMGEFVKFPILSFSRLKQRKNLEGIYPKTVKPHVYIRNNNCRKKVDVSNSMLWINESCISHLSLKEFLDLHHLHHYDNHSVVHAHLWRDILHAFVMRLIRT